MLPMLVSIHKLRLNDVLVLRYPSLSLSLSFFLSLSLSFSQMMDLIIFET
jgi:hypothetical protein